MARRQTNLSEINFKCCGAAEYPGELFEPGGGNISQGIRTGKLDQKQVILLQVMLESLRRKRRIAQLLQKR
tara:strand:- start:327 stop:539 length:213 start_codon:yes stop_codon:yes gene_type:complete